MEVWRLTWLKGNNDETNQPNMDYKKHIKSCQKEIRQMVGYPENSPDDEKYSDTEHRCLRDKQHLMSKSRVWQLPYGTESVQAENV